MNLFYIVVSTSTHDFDLIVLEYAWLEINLNIILIEGFTIFHSLN